MLGGKEMKLAIDMLRSLPSIRVGCFISVFWAAVTESLNTVDYISVNDESVVV